MTTDLWRWDAGALAAAIRTGTISSREATRAVLGRLETVCAGGAGASGGRDRGGGAENGGSVN
jgi:hypothetical protein